MEEEKKQMPERLWLKILAAVLVCAAAVAGGVFLFRSQMKTPVASFCKALSTGDGAYIRQCLSEEAWDYCKKTYEQSNPDSFESHVSMLASGFYDILAKEYGDNFKISFKITEKERIKDGAFAEFADTLTERYGLRKGEITEACNLTVSTACSGDNRSDTSEGEIYTVYQMGEEWYLYIEPVS